MVVAQKNAGFSYRRFYFWLRRLSGRSDASPGAGAGETWSRAPLAGCDRGAGQGRVTRRPCARLRGAAATRSPQARLREQPQKPRPRIVNAALCAPARTTLRETESGAHPRGPLFRPPTRPGFRGCDPSGTGADADAMRYGL